MTDGCTITLTVTSHCSTSIGLRLSIEGLIQAHDTKLPTGPHTTTTEEADMAGSTHSGQAGTSRGATTTRALTATTCSGRQPEAPTSSPQEVIFLGRSTPTLLASPHGTRGKASAFPPLPQAGLPLTSQPRERLPTLSRLREVGWLTTASIALFLALILGRPQNS